MLFNSRTPSTRDDWQTPLHIVNALGAFDLDPCANISEPARCAQAGFSHSGLELAWFGRVWLNPPYGAATKYWLARLAVHGNGIALIPPRMGAKWYHETVLENADAILFLKGRVAFIDAQTGKPVAGNNADSALIAFGQNNVDSLRDCNLQGKLWVF